MKVRFWGTRGSLPAPVTAADIRAKMVRAFEQAVGQNLKTSDQIEAFVDTELDFATAGTYGGNTSCVEIDDGSDEYILCDLGTGARAFGNNFMAAPHPGKKKVFNIFISHIHWDHIMGFPLFTPAYIPGHKIIIHGCHQLLEQAFRTQHSSPGFPIPFDALGADIEFAALQPSETYEVGNLTVRPMLQYHEGDSFGYRFEGNGKSIVYSTDSEHRQDLTEESDAAWAAFVAFFKNADIVIFDAMYSMADAASVKQDWGHSSNIVGVELCHEAGVKHYCMYHHEPIYSDATISQVLAETSRYEEIHDGGPMQVSSVYDGLEIDL